MKELIFVYNANSSLFAQATDFVHKILSPKTYPCNLCAVTYGQRGMKEEWKKFLETLPFKLTFLHKDELSKEYPNLSVVPLPVVFIKDKKNVSKLISAKEINKTKTIKDLRKLLTQKLQGLK